MLSVHKWTGRPAGLLDICRPHKNTEHAIADKQLLLGDVRNTLHDEILRVVSARSKGM